LNFFNVTSPTVVATVIEEVNSITVFLLWIQRIDTLLGDAEHFGENAT